MNKLLGPICPAGRNSKTNKSSNISKIMLVKFFQLNNTYKHHSEKEFDLLIEATAFRAGPIPKNVAHTLCKTDLAF